MSKTKTKACNNHHSEILYTSEDCPLCRKILELDSVLDGKTDIQQQNIADLFLEVGELKKSLSHMQTVVFSKSKPKHALDPLKRPQNKEFNIWADDSQYTN